MTADTEECVCNTHVFFLSLRYYKSTDPAAWINVDKNTGELRVANTIDKESHFVQNGIYNITMKAVDVSKLFVKVGHFLPPSRKFIRKSSA